LSFPLGRPWVQFPQGIGVIGGSKAGREPGS
jgi:hypothetical protein